MYKRTNNGVLNGGCLKCYYNLILILLFIYLFMYLFIYLCIYLFIYLFLTHIMMLS
jgi:hypothetical protein